MPTPVASWGAHRVHGTYRALADGSLLAGTVTVSLPVDVHNVPQDSIIPKGRHIDAQPLNTTEGMPSLDLMVPASDDTDNMPHDFYIEIVVQLTSPRATYTYRIPTPLGGETNLRTILDPASISVTQPLILGVAGGVAVLDADGDVLDADGNKVVGGTGSTYDDTALVARVAAEETARADGDSTLDTRVTALEGEPAPTWSTLTGKPSVIAAGTSQTAARNAIGAGTSSLQLGTGSTTAAAGDHTHSQYATSSALTSHTGATNNPHGVTAAQVGARPDTWTPAIADLPADSVIRSSTTTRPTARTDIMVIFTGADPGNNALAGDLWLGA